MPTVLLHNLLHAHTVLPIRLFLLTHMMPAGRCVIRNGTFIKGRTTGRAEPHATVSLDAVSL